MPDSRIPPAAVRAGRPRRRSASREELAIRLAVECHARGLAGDVAGDDRRSVEASVGARRQVEAVWAEAVGLLEALHAGDRRAAAALGPACDMCGARPAKLYLCGRRCAAHTPAAVAGRPEAGATAYRAPGRGAATGPVGASEAGSVDLARSAVQRRAGGPPCPACGNPVDRALAELGITEHPACGTDPYPVAVGGVA